LGLYIYRNTIFTFFPLSGKMHLFYLACQKGSPSGVATLDEAGKVPSTQLPSYVDDVLEFGSFSLLPASGESGKIYVTLDTNLQYRWSGTAYTEVSKSLALGETPESAHRGDHGKVAYEHVSKTDNPHSVTASQVGLGKVVNKTEAELVASGAVADALALKANQADLELVKGTDWNGETLVDLASRMAVRERLPITTGKNLFNKDTTSDGYYISDTTGARLQNASYFASDYIPVSAGMQLAFSYVGGGTGLLVMWAEGQELPFIQARKLLFLE